VFAELVDTDREECTNPLIQTPKEETREKEHDRIFQLAASM
jgi:putative ubiquitin-RnfH superfamily antitoxin RatB of RatAB toxin-antitoxin module